MPLVCVYPMIDSELQIRIWSQFQHEPTSDQRRAVETFCHFVTDRHNHSLMVLRGSAGTGKTSLAGAIVRAMQSLQQKLVLLAPTGRAAKVFSLNSGHQAYTIHRKIYRQRSAADLSSFALNDNLSHDTLFIIDEASMISSQPSQSPFGSGMLLDDLLQYVYNGMNCRMMLIGDRAQLPPVGETESPALIGSVLHGYGMTVYECDLVEVLRQSRQSGILWNATMIRTMITHDAVTAMPLVRFQGFPDIHCVPGSELIESLSSSYSHVGIDETMVVTRSNKRANIYNQGIRNMVLGCEEELSTGDLLMVVKNNYFVVADKGVDKDSSGLEFIANGDRAVVRRVRREQKLYGFRFVELTLQFPDYDDYEFTAEAILDTLTTEAPALTPLQQQQLYDGVMADYADIPQKSERIKKIKADKYYNSLQVKFAYAVTCHKAQGGQWAHVYVDQGYMTDDMLTPDYIHWLYTAFTRATEQLYLVNWPKQQTAVGN